jgi:exosortase E/protease (VPEID-CTERM system)
MMPSVQPVASPAPLARLMWRVLPMVALVMAELLILSTLYQFENSFECRENAPPALCKMMSTMVLRAISVLGMLLVFVWARPGVMQALGVAATGAGRAPLGWLAMNMAGAVLLAAPWAILVAKVPAAMMAVAFAAWVAGSALAAVGALMVIAPPRAWAAALRSGGPLLAVGLVAAALSPEMARAFTSLWQWEVISEATFQTVVMMLNGIGMDVISDPALRVIGADGFDVSVAQQCSGVEGILLITLFAAFYLTMFRSELRFPHVLVLIPIGLALSWMLNSVRISALIWIGAHVSPDLAVNGFHSHAGWLLFSALSLGMIAVSRTIPWFWRAATDAPRAAAHAPPPIAEDINAAQILPFVAFMVTALIASTFAETPAVHYPLRVLAMAAALVVFRRLYLRFEWRLDPVAIGVGAVIGAVWLMAQIGGGADQTPLSIALAAMTPAMFLLWAVARVAGTALFVPLIEELFFRGYLLRRLDVGGTVMRIVAIAVSSGLFAALHDRWLLAGLAGVAFALLTLRRGRVTDAILAHGVANGIIAAWAAVTGNWSVI